MTGHKGKSKRNREAAKRNTHGGFRYLTPEQQQALKQGRPVALVDVILPVYGEWAFAEKAIAALPAAFQGCSDPYRLIVVDNGTPAWTNTEGQQVSPEDQALAVKAMLRPQDAFFRLPENRGYPGGMNFAAAKGGSPLILILTADVWLHPGAAARLIMELDNAHTGIAGPMLIFPQGSPRGPAERVQHAGIEFNMKGNPFHIFIGWTPDNPKVNRGCEVPAVTGACFLTRRSVWEKLGGFFAGYGKGTFEDIDYCFGVRSGGQRVVYVPEARGYHFVGASMVTGAERQGFNLPLNETIFRGRWAHMLAWTEWRRW